MNSLFVVNSLSNHRKFFRTDYHRINMYNANIAVIALLLLLLLLSLHVYYFENRLETRESHVKY